MTPGDVGMIVTCIVGAFGLYLHGRMVAQHRRERDERYNARMEAIEAECKRLEEKSARPVLNLIQGGKS